MQSLIEKIQKLIPKQNNILISIILKLILVFFYTITSLQYVIYLFFYSPQKSFSSIYTQNQKGIWNKSYYQHRKFRHNVRFGSVSFTLLLVSVVISVNFIMTLIVPISKIEIAYAATMTVNNATDADDINIGNGICETAPGNGICTLRAAVSETSALSGPDVIEIGINNISLSNTIIVNDASSLTINGNGYTVNGSGIAAGETIKINSDNVTINNLLITQSTSIGLHIFGASNFSYIDGQVTSSTSNGIQIDGSSDDIVINGITTSSNSNDGIYASNSSNITITNCTVQSNAMRGIYLDTVSGTSTVSNNTSSGNTGHGLRIASSSDITISGNTISNNDNGLISTNSSSLTINNSNVISSNNDKGIYLNSVSSSAISDNTISDNSSNGVVIVNNSDSNTVSSNTINNNTLTGIVVDSSNYNQLSQNIIDGSNAILLINDGNENLSAPVITTANASTAILHITGSVSEIGTLEIFGATAENTAAVYLDSVSLSSTTINENIAIDATSHSYITATLTDADNNTSQLGSLELTTDIIEPEISNIQVTNITSSSATITFTTDEETSSTLSYGETTSYGTDTDWYPGLTLSHSIVLSDLTASTTYNYQIRVKDMAGNSVVSDNLTFSTDVSGPTISDITESTKETSATITFSTDESAAAYINYGKNTGVANTSSTTVLGTSHSITIKNLEAGTKYFYRITAEDIESNATVSSIFDFTTTSATVTVNTPEIIFPKNNAHYFTPYLVKNSLPLLVTADSDSSGYLNIYIDQIKQKNTENKYNQLIESGESNFQVPVENNETGVITNDVHELEAKVTNSISNSNYSDATIFTLASAKYSNIITIEPDINKRDKNAINTTQIAKPTLVSIAPNNNDFKEIQMWISNNNSNNEYILDGLATITSNSSGSILHHERTPFLNLPVGATQILYKAVNVSGDVYWESDPFGIVYYKPCPAVWQGFSGTYMTWLQCNDQEYEYFIFNDSIAITTENYKAAIDGKSYQVYGKGTVSSGSEHLTTSVAADPFLALDSGNYTIVIRTFKKIGYPSYDTIIKDSYSKPQTTTTPKPAPAPNYTPDTIEEDVNINTEVDAGIDSDSVNDQPEQADQDKETAEIFNRIIDIVEKVSLKKEKFGKIKLPSLTTEKVSLTEEEKQVLIENLNSTTIDSNFVISFNGQTIIPEVQNDGSNVYRLRTFLDLSALLRKMFRLDELILTKKELIVNSTIPQSELDKLPAFAIVIINSDPVVKMVQADANGKWSITIPLELLPPGQHTAYAQTEINGVQSDQVELVKFVVEEETKLSKTTWLIIINIIIAIVLILVAIVFQVVKNKKLKTQNS